MEELNENYDRQVALSRLFAEVAQVGLTELFVEIEECLQEYKNEDKRINLFLKYSEWDKNALKCLTKSPSYSKYYNDWLSINAYYPKNYKFIKGSSEELGFYEIARNLEFLRSLLRQKKEIIEKFANGPELAVSKNDREDFFRFWLKDNELSRKAANGDPSTYKMMGYGVRYNIIKMLAKSPGKFIPTKDLAEFCKTSEVIVRKEIRAIRKEIEKNFLGIKGKEFIGEGQRKLGYALGKNIRIELDLPIWDK